MGMKNNYRDILATDTRVGMFTSLQSLDIKVAKSLKKGELVDILDELFIERPFYIIDRLPKVEQDLLAKLIGCKQSEYVEVPISGKPPIQRHAM